MFTLYAFLIIVLFISVLREAQMGSLVHDQQTFPDSLRSKTDWTLEEKLRRARRVSRKVFQRAVEEKILGE